jgi:hypothetical protein
VIEGGVQMDKVDRILEALNSLEQRVSATNQLMIELKQEQEELREVVSGLLEMLTRGVSLEYH